MIMLHSAILTAGVVFANGLGASAFPSRHRALELEPRTAGIPEAYVPDTGVYVCHGKGNFSQPCQFMTVPSDGLFVPAIVQKRGMITSFGPDQNVICVLRGRVGTIDVRTVYHPGLNFAQLENTEWLGRIDEFVCMRKSVMAESALMKDGHVQFLDAEW